MLRCDRRWHDAANGPLDWREARLLSFSAKKRDQGTPPTGGIPDDGDEEYTPVNEDDENDANEARGTQRRLENDAERSAAAYQEYERRRMKDILHPVSEEEATVPNVLDVLTNANRVQTQLEMLLMTLESTQEKARQKHSEGISLDPTSNIDAIDSTRRVIDAIAKQNKSRVFALERFHAVEWERGDMPPSEFLRRYREYIEDLATIDEADTSLTDEKRKMKKEARESAYEETQKAVEHSLQTQPKGIAPNDVRRARSSVTDDMLWKLYDKDEKRRIIQSISQAASLDELKYAMSDDLEAVDEWMKNEDISKKVLTMQRTVIEADETSQHAFQTQTGGIMAPGDDPVTAISTLIAKCNGALGIEWLTLYEWKAAFDEVIASIKEVRKRKSIGRITRAALGIGRVAAFLPGTGGQDLINVLEEQQQKKNDEIKDDFKKELGDPRKDYGFKDMFGDGKGSPGLLKTCLSLHDTNRSRAIIEFAASKGMLFDIDSESWETYILPGGIRFQDAMPSEWNGTQMSTYFENQQFANRQGAEAATKAGETLVKGRNSFDGYTDPFEGAVNGMSLWFAKGIANQALSKVKNGHMSAMLTLIVLKAWETNPLFRKYVPSEWLDRLAGDHKQMFIGMIKYDQGHLLAGARDAYKKGATVTSDLAHANANEHDPTKPQPRLGPLVVAIRNHLIEKDPSLASKDKDTEKELMETTAKVMASQTVKLKNGTYVSIYDPALAPYQITYGANEMRGANVQAMGDDHFIERSEITHGTVEVMKSVGAVGQDGFVHGEKARYYFSHIIDNYEELLMRAAEQKKKNSANALELETAAAQFKNFINPQLNEWVKEALGGVAGYKLTNIKHKEFEKDGRYLLLTLMENGLISPSIIEKLSRENNKGAKKLMEMYGNNQHDTANGRRAA